MVTLNDMASAIYGAYRLARADTGGMAFFERSPAGAVKSFFAAVVVLPAYALFQAFHYWGQLGEIGLSKVVAIEGLIYVIGWTAFPVIMISVTRWIDRQERYVDFLVAYNWSSVIQTAVLLPVVIIAETGALPEPLIAIAGLVLKLAVLVYLWFVVKTALNIAGPLAAGLVFADYVLSLIILGVSDGLIQPG